MEKVLAEIDAAFFFRQLIGIERRNAKHLARTFAVAGRDDRCMDVEEFLLLKKLVN